MRFGGMMLAVAPAPTIEAPHQHGIDLPATGGLQEQFALRAVLCTGADRLNLAHD
jgi:hypothetical protein